VLEIVGFEVMAEGVRDSKYIFLQVPNEVLTNGMKSRLMFDNLRIISMQ